MTVEEQALADLRTAYKSLLPVWDRIDHASETFMQIGDTVCAIDNGIGLLKKIVEAYEKP